MDKKQHQLEMNPSTASNRLVKDTLFRLALEAGYKCHHCGEELTRETFSVEHKVPWLDSPDPKTLFFDQKNVAFSHLQCNMAEARRKTVSPEQTLERKRNYMREWRTPEKRREQYLRTKN
jgi:hypothetical protein